MEQSCYNLVQPCLFCMGEAGDRLTASWDVVKDTPVDPCDSTRAFTEARG